MKLKPLNSRERRRKEAENHNRIYLKYKEFIALIAKSLDMKTINGKEHVAFLLGNSQNEKFLDSAIKLMRDRLRDLETIERGL